MKYSSLVVSERICAVNAASEAESAVRFFFHFLVNRLKLRGSRIILAQSLHVACVILAHLPGLKQIFTILR